MKRGAAAGQRCQSEKEQARRQCHPTRDQVICDALDLALVATHLRVVWHARAITAESAMQLLDQAFREIRVRHEEQANGEMTDSCSGSSRTGETS